MRIGFLALLVAVGSVFSQETHVGFGVGLEKNLIQVSGSGDIEEMASIDVLPVSFTTFSVPILIQGAVKVEPEIGYVRFGASVEDELSGDYESSASIWQLAVGISGGKRVDNLLYQFGVRVGMIRQSSSTEQDSDEYTSSQMSFHVGPILGAEYFFHSRMSVGAQVGFSYIHIGQPNVEFNGDSADDDEDISQSMFGNNGKISLRWYY